MQKTKSCWLAQPVQVSSVLVRSFKIKEPTGAEVMRYGDPFDRSRVGAQESSTINHRSAVGYLMDCATVPQEVIAKLAAPDFVNAVAQAVQFFIDAGGPPDPWVYYSELADRFYWQPSEVAAMPLSECMQWYVQTAQRDERRAAEREESQTSWG